MKHYKFHLLLVHRSYLKKQNETYNNHRVGDIFGL